MQNKRRAICHGGGGRVIGRFEGLGVCEGSIKAGWRVSREEGEEEQVGKEEVNYKAKLMQEQELRTQ